MRYLKSKNLVLKTGTEDLAKPSRSLALSHAFWQRTTPEFLL